MAKALIACFRQPGPRDFGALVDLLEERIPPDNAEVRAPYVWREPGLLSYLHNPAPTVRTAGPSICLGTTVEPFERVSAPASPRPDGSFALLRADGRTLEALTDCTASRTLWYCQTEHLVAVSSSQRMIVMLLGAFAPEPRATVWMLTNGHLGPGVSWDSRIRTVPPNSLLRLDRATWTVTLDDRSRLDVEPVAAPPRDHRQSLALEVRDAIAGTITDAAQWTLALSGGVDSRSLLFHLRGRRGLESVTWGVSRASREPTGDAAIARTLAERCRVPHRYVPTDVRPDSVTDTFRRFVLAGEGRIDHLPGYMDSLAFWGDLSRTGRGILRGYDAFGTKPPVATEYQARRASSVIYTRDYGDATVLQPWDCSERLVPPNVLRRADEPLDAWRDRLWLSFRTPVVTAALDEIKTAYVEIANPLLCSRVVDVVRTLPGPMRTNKAVFREIVREMFPDVPFARRLSVQHMDDLLRLPAVSRALGSELREAEGAPMAIERRHLQILLGALQPRPRPVVRRRLEGLVRTYLPDRIQGLLRLLVRREPLSVRRVAFRAYLVERMHRLLTEDALAGRARLGEPAVTRR